MNTNFNLNKSRLILSGLSKELQGKTISFRTSDFNRIVNGYITLSEDNEFTTSVIKGIWNGYYEDENGEALLTMRIEVNRESFHFILSFDENDNLVSELPFTIVEK